MTALDDLRKKSSSDSPLEESSAAPGVPSFPPVEPTATEDSSNGGKEPFGVHSVITNCGYEIYYQAGPKRLYRIRETVPEALWMVVPSVSEVLDILNKPGLPWWGMKVGVEGMCELLSIDTGQTLSYAAERDIEVLVDLLTKHKITVNHVRDKAGDRGTAVHDALELWAEEGITPNPTVFAPEEQGYVRGLKQFIIESGAQPIVSEVMVASVEHQFAGRPDLVATIPNGALVCTKSYPKKKSVMSEIPGGDWLLDLKTSKGVYESHHLQLDAYELALKESWGRTVEHAGVIHVFDDGRYELVTSKAQPGDFLRVRSLYDTMKRLK